MTIEDARAAQQMLTMSQRLGRLATVTTELLEADTLASVSTVITEHLTEAAGATVGSFSLLADGETLALIGIHGTSESVASRWATYPVAATRTTPWISV